MAVKKKATKRTTRKVSSVVESEAMASEMTTDTKTIIVVLLLIFIYPLGAIFMWVWMKWWPMWVRILLTIPFILGILAMIFGLLMAGFIVRSAVSQQEHMNTNPYQRRMYAPQRSPNRMYISPTPSPVSYSNY
ncbi:MAG TPA: hypothetical protein VLG12_00580 [Candidatus Saccharimonadales bacterium]|nr:hypothetical protein [Candidatus Saccharimonadales bacterium]